MTDYEKVEQLAAEVASKLGITLHKCFDEEMKEDPTNYGKDDLTKGIFYDVEDIKNNIHPKMNFPLILGISVDEKFQFHHDATPYPTSLNTTEEARYMMQTLCECPMPIKDLTPEIYQAMIDLNIDNFLAGE